MTKQAQNLGQEPHGTRLNSLVDEAQALMDQLGAISDGQHYAIRSGDIAQVLEVISKREPVVNGLVSVGEEIEAFIKDPGMLAKVPSDERSAALERITLIEIAMGKLREHDAQDQKIMESTRDGLASQLAGMGTGKSALRAYSSRTSTPNPTLHDRQG